MINKNILVTGANGQLAQEIKEIVSLKEYKSNYFFKGKEELNILDKTVLENFIKVNKINQIINCAAYTNVDAAEDNIELAYSVNELAVKNLTELCELYAIDLIHISTDYVFGGKQNMKPLKEDDKTAPDSVYGKSKLKGEEIIIKSKISYIIIRTSWLYSSFGNNFVKKIIALSKEKSKLEVVIDQIGTPTYARDLASFICYLIEKEDLEEKKGVYHFSNEGVCTWFDLAFQAVKISGEKSKVTPCNSEKYPSKVKRPLYSVLDKNKVKNSFNFEIPYWQDSLEECVEKLKTL